MTRSGLILDARYRLDERIAAGGVGQVWLATDQLLDRAVAVKVLRPEYSDHPETLDRFRKEARHAGALSNSHVAQVYDYGASGPDGSPYLVMEYVDGPSLADLLAVDPLEPIRALDIISQAADGLSAAHRAGLVHRDVKPGNILINKEGQVKVTDFGIAHAAGQVPVTGPGLVMGTTQYMAPERIAGGQGTAASDVYALGIVLHECLTGVPPHDGMPSEVMAAHLYLPLPPLPAGTPPELEDLVARLTVKDPAQRISDALELADRAAMLRDLLSGGTFVPSARTGAHTGAVVVAPSLVSQGAVLTPGPVLADGGGPPALEDPVGGAAYGVDERPMDLGPTVLDIGGVVPPPNGHGGPTAYPSDEWKVPARMSLPTQAGQPKARRRAGAIAVGAAVVASGSLVVLLVTGAFNGASTANQQPAGSPATARPAASQVPSPASSGSAHTTQPAVGGTSPAGVLPSTQPASSAAKGKTSTASPSGSRSSAPASGGTATGGTPTTPATPPPSTPGNGQSTAPSDTPSTPAPSPSKTACLLIICL